MKKLTKIMSLLLFGGAMFFFNGCYTVVWTPDNEVSEDYSGQESNTVVEYHYYNWNFDYYYTPWWIDIPLPKPVISNPQPVVSNPRPVETEPIRDPIYYGRAPEEGGTSGPIIITRPVAPTGGGGTTTPTNPGGGTTTTTTPTNTGGNKNDRTISTESTKSTPARTTSPGTNNNTLRNSDGNKSAKSGRK